MSVVEAAAQAGAVKLGTTKAAHVCARESLRSTARAATTKLAGNVSGAESTGDMGPSESPSCMTATAKPAANMPTAESAADVAASESAPTSVTAATTTTTTTTTMAGG
jgi:hypothetical protein